MRSCFIRSPEICDEVISPSNSEEEVREKMALYFDAGAKEVWISDVFGAMTFYRSVDVTLPRSTWCPDFPEQS